MKKYLFSVGVSLFLAAVLTARLSAQTNDPPVGVAVKIWAQSGASSDGASLTVWGDFLESSPGANNGSATATSTADSGDGLLTILGAQGYVRVEPAKIYQVNVSSSNADPGSIHVLPPSGYRVIMDNMLRTVEPFSGSGTFTFQLLPLGAKHPGLAGMASSISSLDIEWRVSLGSLRNGGSAGDLALIDTGMKSNWSAIFTPSSLYYQAVAAEISVYAPSNILRQIIANQVVVDIVTLNSTSYEIRCYNPAQMQAGSFPRTFTGSAYMTYRVEQGATSTTLKITREVRNVTNNTSTFTIARTEVTSLARTGTWPVVTWTKSDWTLSGATALTETYVSSSGTTSARSEDISVRVPGSSTPALKLTRNYSVPLLSGQSYIGEVLSSETVGSTNGMSASFSYYTDPSQFGSLGYLKSATLPGGTWVAYDYYAADPTNGDVTGKVKYRYKPFLNAPATVTQSSTQGEVTYYEYVNDIFGAATRPSLVQTSVNNVLTAKSVTAYTGYGGFNGYQVDQSTRSDYYDATHNLATQVRYYREDCSEAFIRGQTYSILSPDGVKKSFVYQLGTWNGTAFTVGSGNLGSGTASRIAVITGTSNSTAGVSAPAENSYLIDQVYLVDSKSTRDVTIRDGRALVVRTESYVWKASAWNLVSSTNFAYDYAGRLTSRIGSNGATYTASYDGGLKTAETDEAGVITDYAYDPSDDVVTSTREACGVIGALATAFTYDAAGHITQEMVGPSSGEHVTTTRTFDDAGRVVTEAPPGNYGSVSHSYDVANRIHTVTRADSSTVITTNNLDGSPTSTTGTSAVPAYHTYGIETDGRRWHQANSGTSSSPRYQKSWVDWLGRGLETDQPGFTGQATVVATNVYESGTGHLVKTTKVGYAPALYQYNALGQVSRSGLDYDNNGLLDIVSSDRISETETYLESYNSAWWMRTDSRSYPRLGQNTLVVTSTSRTRLTGHPTNRFSETQSIDAEGNVTTQTVDVNRSAKTSTATTTRSGISGSMVESTVNGFSTSITSFDGLTATTAYDSLLRKATATDSRGNTSTVAYLSGTAMPSTVTDAAGDVVATAYDANGRTAWQRDARNFYTRFGYNARDQLVHQWGDGTMPVEYGYDSTYGDRTTMSTFRGGTGFDTHTGDLGNTANPWPTSTAGTADTTTWTYDGPSGLLTTKLSSRPDSSAAQSSTNLPTSVTQTYNNRGQTAVRTLARGVTATYGYDNATGELLTQTYSDSTPAVTYTYGRTGQVESVSDFTGLRDLVYDTTKPWRLTAEAESAFYGSRVLTRTYDETGTIGRVHGFQLGAAAGGIDDLEQTFGFTTVGRFSTISSNRNGAAASAGRTFRYGYLTNSALLSSVSVDSNAFTITRSYEAHRDLITSINSQWSTASRSKYDYTYDERGLRTTSVQSGDAFADYGDSTHHIFTYNGRGEVTGDVGFMNGTPTDQSAPLPGRHYGFGYDNAGNRKWSDRTGVDLNSDGLPDLRDTYTTNALNQYTSRDNNSIPASGTAAVDAGGAGGTSVAVQGGSQAPVAAGRQGHYWNDEVLVPNVLHAWRGPLTIFTAKRGTGGSADVYRADTRMAEIAGMIQNFVYDADGNLTSDGLVDYQYDAENRLIRMETTSTAVSYNFPHKLLEFRYDYMGRRVQKRVVDVDASVEVSCRRSLYDGWNLVAEYSAPGGTTIGALLRSYTWGLDIALSMSNAGGVGALLQIADHP